MMQIQSDVLTISVHRPEMTEVTALGAAIAAGIAIGVWKDLEDMETAFGDVHKEDVFTGLLNDEQRQKKWDLWNWGVERSFGWVTEKLEDVQNVNAECEIGSIGDSDGVS
jgi:glycerol kinase